MLPTVRDIDESIYLQVYTTRTAVYFDRENAECTNTPDIGDYLPPQLGVSRRETVVVEINKLREKMFRDNGGAMLKWSRGPFSFSQFHYNINNNLTCIVNTIFVLGQIRSQPCFPVALTRNC